MAEQARTAIPLNMALRFSAIVNSMVEPFGINEIPEAVRYLALMDAEINRHVFNLSLPDDTKTRLAAERARFIAHFMRRYRERSGMDYSFSVSPAEAKHIGRVLLLVEKKGFTLEEYLNWVFDVFLDANPSRVYNLSGVLTNYVVESFLIPNRDLMEQKQRDAIKKAERLDLVNRINTVRRKHRGTAKEKDAEDIANKFREGKTDTNKIKGLLAVLEK